MTRPLPAEVVRLLESLEAPPRLVAHLALVYDAACEIFSRCDAAWPSLVYDRESVRLGAAIQDIGKTTYPAELTGPSHAHEAAGEALLMADGWLGRLARFGRTHAQWPNEPTPPLEDLLVARANNWWRGRREDGLEAVLLAQIAGQTRKDAWQVYLTLATIAEAVTAGADERIIWQSRHAL